MLAALFHCMLALPLPPASFYPFSASCLALFVLELPEVPREGRNKGDLEKGFRNYYGLGHPGSGLESWVKDSMFGFEFEFVKTVRCLDDLKIFLPDNKSMV